MDRRDPKTKEAAQPGGIAQESIVVTGRVKFEGVIGRISDAGPVSSAHAG
jgi:hypothetical protein